MIKKISIECYDVGSKVICIRNNELYVGVIKWYAFDINDGIHYTIETQGNMWYKVPSRNIFESKEDYIKHIQDKILIAGDK